MASMHAYFNSHLESTVPGVTIVGTVAGAFFAPSARPSRQTSPEPGPAGHGNPQRACGERSLQRVSTALEIKSR
jgi:hypothetical protein